MLKRQKTNASIEITINKRKVVQSEIERSIKILIIGPGTDLDAGSPAVALQSTWITILDHLPPQQLLGQIKPCHEAPSTEFECRC